MAHGAGRQRGTATIHPTSASNRTDVDRYSADRIGRFRGVAASVARVRGKPSAQQLYLFRIPYRRGRVFLAGDPIDWIGVLD